MGMLLQPSLPDALINVVVGLPITVHRSTRKRYQWSHETLGEWRIGRLANIPRAEILECENDWSVFGKPG